MDAVDWKNFPASAVPRSQVTTERSNKMIAVKPASGEPGSLGPVETGPSQVFPKGFPTGEPKGMIASIVPLASSEQTGILSLHGVADKEEVVEILHPENQTLVQSVASKNMFLVTKDFKVVDASAHRWPIDVNAAEDYRSRIGSAVKYGDHVGVVTAKYGDRLLVTAGKEILKVSAQDLRPIKTSTGGK